MIEGAEEAFPLALEWEAVLDGSPSIATLDRIMSFRTYEHFGELRAALERIEAGTYGLCVVCRRPIDEGILLQAPVERVCSSCTSDLTRRKGKSKGRLRAGTALVPVQVEG